VSSIFRFDIAEILPEPDDVYRGQGILEAASVQDRIEALLTESLKLFADIAAPIGILSELSIREFESVFEGEGKNAADNPVEHIYPEADRLALFALTLGRDISEKIEMLFKEREFALGAMLDSVASLSADMAVEVLESRFHRSLSDKKLIEPDCIVLSYSPGYCGWDISGQKRLFRRLDPGRIDITLNESSLMSPLKSVTGILIAGDREIHFFENNYPVCRKCETHSCRLRMTRVMKSSNSTP
jgi:hypothetical protein